MRHGHGIEGLERELALEFHGHLDGDLNLAAGLERDRAGRDVDRTAALRLADDLALPVVRLQQNLEVSPSENMFVALDRKVHHGQPRGDPLRAVLVGERDLRRRQLEAAWAA